jgi:hypothetical protein
VELLRTNSKIDILLASSLAESPRFERSLSRGAEVRRIVEAASCRGLVLNEGCATVPSSELTLYPHIRVSVSGHIAGWKDGISVFAGWSCDILY